MPVSDWLQGKTDWTTVVFGNGSGPFGRPLSMASFVLNTIVLGQSFWSLKFGNLLIHLANGLLVYALLRVAHTRGRDDAIDAPLRAVDASTRRRHLAAASAVAEHGALCRAAHGDAQHVSSCSARCSPTCTGASRSSRAGARRAYLLLGIAVPAATVLALLSKENGVLVPLLCGVIELFAFQPGTGQRRPHLSQWFVAATIGAADRRRCRPCRDACPYHRRRLRQPPVYTERTPSHRTARAVELCRKSRAARRRASRPFPRRLCPFPWLARSGNDFAGNLRLARDARCRVAYASRSPRFPRWASVSSSLDTHSSRARFPC